MLENINFWLGKMFYQKKEMLKKAVTMKRFEYLPLGKELKAQADISKKQYQKLDNTYELHKIIKKEKSTLKDYSKSKYLFLTESFNDLNKSNKLQMQNKKTENLRTSVYNTDSEWYNDLSRNLLMNNMNYQMLKEIKWSTNRS